MNNNKNQYDTGYCNGLTTTTTEHNLTWIKSNRTDEIKGSVLLWFSFALSLSMAGLSLPPSLVFFYTHVLQWTSLYIKFNTHIVRFASFNFACVFNRSACCCCCCYVFNSFLLLRLHRDMCLFSCFSLSFFRNFVYSGHDSVKFSWIDTPCAYFFSLWLLLPLLLVLLLLCAAAGIVAVDVVTSVVCSSSTLGIWFRTHTHAHLRVIRFDCKWKQGDHWLHRWFCALPTRAHTHKFNRKFYRIPFWMVMLARRTSIICVVVSEFH